jgi:hypothetical protein
MSLLLFLTCRVIQVHPEVHGANNRVDRHEAQSIQELVYVVIPGIVREEKERLEKSCFRGTIHIPNTEGGRAVFHIERWWLLADDGGSCWAG